MKNIIMVCKIVATTFYRFFLMLVNCNAHGQVKGLALSITKEKYIYIT
jgi:hypothetical protein